MATNNKPQGFHPGAALVGIWPKPVVVRGLFYTATLQVCQVALKGKKDE